MVYSKIKRNYLYALFSVAMTQSHLLEALQYVEDQRNPEEKQNKLDLLQTIWRLPVERGGELSSLVRGVFCE